MTKKQRAFQKTVAALIATGAILLLSALFLFLYNRAEDWRAGERAGALLADREAVRMETAALDGLTDAPRGENESDPKEEKRKTAEMDGDEPIGTLEIPALELALPVLPQWDYDRLKIAPCRQFGSPETDDLVIAGHNYKSHFGSLKKLVVGDTVLFTGRDGLSTAYSVEEICVLQPEEIRAVKESSFALTLYTCTYSGKGRIAVFCGRLYADT